MADVSINYSVASLKERELSIPYWEVRADAEGPTLLITASLHGNEVQGADVMRRILPLLSEQLQSGSVLMAPFANLPAVWNRRPHADSGPETPYGDRNVQNINRTWPGNPGGTDPERITYALNRDLVLRATHCIDIHCWPRTSGTTVLLRQGDKDAVHMTRQTALRFASPRVTRPKAKSAAGEGQTLRDWFGDTGRTSICIEVSGQYMIVPEEAQRVARAVTNCAKSLGLLPGAIEGQEEPMVWIDEAARTEVAAPHSGLFSRADWVPSDRVGQGELLGHVLSDENLAVTEVRAPVSGYLWRYGSFRNDCDVALPGQHPYVTEGEAIAVIMTQ